MTNDPNAECVKSFCIPHINMCAKVNFVSVEKKVKENPILWKIICKFAAVNS